MVPPSPDSDTAPLSGAGCEEPSGFLLPLRYAVPATPGSPSVPRVLAARGDGTPRRQTWVGGSALRCVAAYTAACVRRSMPIFASTVDT